MYLSERSGCIEVLNVSHSFYLYGELTICYYNATASSSVWRSFLFASPWSVFANAYSSIFSVEVILTLLELCITLVSFCKCFFLNPQCGGDHFDSFGGFVLSWSVFASMLVTRWKIL